MAKKVDEKYEVRGIFLTNGKRDNNAIAYLAHNPGIVLFDHDELQDAYTPLDKTAPIATKVSLSVADGPHIEYQLTPKVNMVLASLSAQELLKMGGIANGELFAWNVRQWLGRKTRVNKDIEKSIKSASDHQLFPAFHNGLTVLCNSLKVAGDTITISGYAVVNGCQSLTSLYENRNSLTKDLRIITKFLNVPPDGELAAKITDHTNNQNGTTFRDLQSNNPIQVRLQSEIHRKYSGVHYRIKRGEHVADWDAESVIENELAARILLAFDLKEPSTCHQFYKLFDELHAKIFGRPEVNADRIVFLHDIYQIVDGLVKSMQNELFGNYSLTRFLILYLIREALETDSRGKELCQNPGSFLEGGNGREKLAKVIEKTVARPIVNMLDTDVTRRNEEGFFDYKSDLKSPKKIGEIKAMILSHYKIVISGGYTTSFSQEWDGKTKTKKSARTRRA